MTSQRVDSQIAAFLESILIFAVEMAEKQRMDFV